MKLFNILSNIGLLLLLAVAVFLVFSLAAISDGGYDDPNCGTTGLVMQDTDPALVPGMFWAYLVTSNYAKYTPWTPSGACPGNG